MDLWRFIESLSRLSRDGYLRRNSDRFCLRACDAFEFLKLAEEVFDQVAPLVDLSVDRQRRGRRGCCEMTILAPRSLRSAMMELLSKALSAMKPSKARPSMSGATPTVSKRWPDMRTKRTRLPSASVSARILVVMPPLEQPMAWL